MRQKLFAFGDDFYIENGAGLPVITPPLLPPLVNFPAPPYNAPQVTMREPATLRRLDFTLAMVTFLGVLTFDEALWALLLAVGLSLLALVWRTSQGRMNELGLVRDKLSFEGLGSTPGITTINGLLIFAPEESLFFANSDTIRVQITNRLAAITEQVNSGLLDLKLTNDLDVPSADMLKELHHDLEAAGVQLRRARLRLPVRDLLDRRGVTGAIGEEHIYNRVLEGAILHLSERYAEADTFLGLSGGELKRLQKVVDGMLIHAEGDQQAQLKALAAQLSMAIDENTRS